MKVCENCCKEFKENNNYCAVCGTQLINKKKKDAFNLLSIISIILFTIVVILNGVFYFLGKTVGSDSIGAGQELGWYWIFFGFLPSIPLLGSSIITAIISVVLYFCSLTKKEIINAKKNILVSINIIQIIIVLTILIILFIGIYNLNSYNYAI